MIRTRILQRSVEFMAIVAVVAMVATIILFTQVYSHDTALKMQRDFENCVIGNQTREGLDSLVDSDRAFLDQITPEKQVDVSGLQDPALKSLAELAQARNRAFRARQLAAEQQQLDKFAAINCEALKDG